MSSSRRAFLQSAAWSGVALAQTGPAASTVPPERRVYLVGDGVISTPAEYARLLTRIADEHGIAADNYLQGGAVEQLEQRFAKLLGKERAMFMPTGTLANHMAVRELAGDKRRVIVQQESHLYADEGDGAQLLSGLNLVPLGPGRATIRLDEVIPVVERSAGPPYPAPVGAISIESPVRRSSGEVVDFEEMKKICTWARERQIGTHLDGARVFLAAAYTGISPTAYAALFDTVYVSMYKYFNAPFGAVLAGPAAMLNRISTLRHQLGGMIYHGWEPAAIALHYYEGFVERYQAAVKNGETLIRLLEAQGKIRVERVSRGSNIFVIRLSGGTAGALQQKLAQAGIVIRGAGDSAQTMIQVNETLNRRPVEEIAREFARAIG
ncbi:L-threonine aldolase [Candidatus Sulfopaludibacter sp. SbA4]|nr:L-threonine aldolase [Candidatus Sulfopaludibacter sp. SbA4]